MSPLCPCSNQGTCLTKFWWNFQGSFGKASLLFLSACVFCVSVCAQSAFAGEGFPCWITGAKHLASLALHKILVTTNLKKRSFCIGRKAYWFICVNLSKHATLYMQLEAYVLVNLPRCTAHSSDPITAFYSRGLYEKTLVAVWPMACRQKKINHISLLHGFLLQICILRKQWLLFDRWHEDRRKLITSACFMASYCEVVLWKNSCCCLTNGMQPEENISH